MEVHVTSDNDNMEDVCDGNYVRSLPFLQQNPNALQVILSYDDLESVNLLGVHTKKYQVGMFYYTLGNIPPLY